ncbi:MAG: SPOR domain-containing protein [Gracilimonas sp.]|uniref:SPOR domain-containing protein n=1 Tax=Gracilimonas TaxID=649462 RepID=UPI001B1C7AC0|nr:SPOR domain-containing protein [Gracilimonas sp.]MBO6584895.1 SPOR domain-containing protein [Gracilimonas sp.]MBO6615834.1 SPOR domain-containing protein [Gracilimonas sp.]
MHIDHQKLVELLTETSGIEKETVESQLEELVEEIKEAITEGDAYEVSGLGVFSGIGNNILFIPSDDFATEINYKYVGMEPIEMDDAAPETTEEAPQPEEDEDASEESDEVVADAGEDDDPFGGLLEDEGEEDEEPPSFELDDSDDEPIDEDTSEDIEEFADEEEEAPFDFADEDLEDDTEEEISDAEEPKPGPDKWGIDTYKDDSAERTFSGLLGDKDDEEAEESSETDDSDLAAELNKQLSEGDDEDDSLDALFGDADVEEELDDESGGEDDPFAALAGDEEESEETPDELIDSDVIEEDQDEIIPVITNLASEETKKKRAEQEKEQPDQKEEETAEKEDESSKRPNRPSTSRDSQGAPVLLWVLLIIVLLAGGTYGLGYFGVVNIPGITPQAPQQASATQPDPVPLPPADETPTQPAQQNNQTNQGQGDSETSSDDEPAPQEAQNPPQEQATDNQVSQSEAVPAGQPMYGLNGVVNPNANDGYTIVVYSLSSERNAKSIEKELSDDGYRVLLATITSQQYGRLWRVSLGQFESMRNAAIAAETLDSPLSENYFITKIN